MLTSKVTTVLICCELAEGEIPWRVSLGPVYELGLGVACTSTHILRAGPEPRDHSEVQMRLEDVVQLLPRKMRKWI